MPLYGLSCGHTTMAKEGGHDALCVWCNAPARLDDAPIGCGVPNVIPDLHEHFNLSLDQPVRSRRHLRQLQEKYGCQDYDRLKDPQTGAHDAWKYAKARDQ